MDVTNLLRTDSGLVARRVVVSDELVHVEAEPVAASATCPHCGVASQRVHAASSRMLADLPWQGRRVVIQLRIRRFKCPNQACPKLTFVERLPMWKPHARTTTRLEEVHRSIGLTVGGEPGSRLAHRLAMPTSPDTLLRRARQAGVPNHPTPRYLGVDDFAFRRNLFYGTILVDLERRRIVDLLPNREAATLAAWLRSHTGVEVISRDRASAYAQAANEAASAATQVADRWHLLSNLRDRLEKLLQQRSAEIRKHLSAMRYPTANPTEDRRTADLHGPDAWAHTAGTGHRTARFELVQQLYEEGMSLRTIRRTLGLNYQTVERYVRSQTCPDWQPGRTRPSCLDPYAEFIRRRWDDGCRCAAQIHRELQEQGCRCGKSIVKEFIRGLKLDREVEQSREAPDVTRDHPAMLSFRQLATAIIRKPVERTERERRQLACLEAGDRELCEAITLGERFGRMVRERRGGDLGAWLRDARASSWVAMRAFARRINQDERAVQAGLDLDWSNGQVEGQVNRLKLVKRMMYGRGGFELLRARLLNAG